MDDLDTTLRNKTGLFFANKPSNFMNVPRDATEVKTQAKTRVKVGSEPRSFNVFMARICENDATLSWLLEWNRVSLVFIRS